MATPERQGTVVVGLGRSGIGAARLLRALGEPVCLAESRSGDALAEQAAALETEGIPVHLGLPLDAERFFDAFTPPPATVVVSPGIRFDHPALEALRARGVAVQGELVGAWKAGRAVPWIGITGTNGKTTVTHLVHHLLVAGGWMLPSAATWALPLPMWCASGSLPAGPPVACRPPVLLSPLQPPAVRPPVLLVPAGGPSPTGSWWS